jgi:hypothetical protein
VSRAINNPARLMQAMASTNTRAVELVRQIGVTGGRTCCFIDPVI